MADVYAGPFAGLSDLGASITGCAASLVGTMIDDVAALFSEQGPSGVASLSAAASKPDFDQIPPHTQKKVRDELTELKSRIQAGRV